MDVSGQSMLPMAAIGATMMPGALFKVLAAVLAVIAVGIALVRLRSRRERMIVDISRPLPAKPRVGGRTYHRRSGRDGV